MISKAPSIDIIEKATISISTSTCGVTCSVKSFENLLLIIWDFTDEYLRHKPRPVLSDNCSVPENFYGGAQTPSHLT